MQSLITDIENVIAMFADIQIVVQPYAKQFSSLYQYLVFLQALSNAWGSVGEILTHLSRTYLYSIRLLQPTSKSCEAPQLYEYVLFRYQSISIVSILYNAVTAAYRTQINNKIIKRVGPIPEPCMMERVIRVADLCSPIFVNCYLSVRNKTTSLNDIICRDSTV